MRTLPVKTFAVTLVVLILAYLLLRRQHSPELDPPAVLAQVQKLNQLATVRYTIQKVVGMREQKQPVGEESILLIMQASVQAGINLAGLRREDVRVLADGTVQIGLPPARILDVAVDEKETKVWDRQKSWWAPWVPYSLDLDHRARLAGIESVKQAALRMGILAQAQLNAEASIRGLLGLVGVKSVSFVPANST